MGVCINILGLPILEDKECATARRNARARRKEAKYDFKIDKGSLDALEDLYGGPSTFEQLGGRFFDHIDASSEAAISTFGPAAAQVGTAYATGGTSLLGGLFGGAPAPVGGSSATPLLVLGAVGLGLALLATSGGK